MTDIDLVEREMTDAEFTRMNEGFSEHTIQHCNPIETQERFGFVALNQGEFIGCSTGLAYNPRKIAQRHRERWASVQVRNRINDY